MKLKNLRNRINNAVNENDDPVLLEMVLRIFQNSATVRDAKTDKKAALSRDGRVAYSDILRQSQGCLPVGK